jgi:adenylate cyclase
MQQYYPMTREGLAEAIRLAHRALGWTPVRLCCRSGRCLPYANILQGHAIDPQFDRKEQFGFFAVSVDDGDPDTLAMAQISTGWSAIAKVRSKWPTGRSRSTPIHFLHGTPKLCLS